MTTALICDDELLLREQLRARLSRHWPELEIVSECTNGAEALSTFEDLLPDVVFLDIHMPVMNGIDAARVIGRGRDRNGEFHRVHIVFVTAFDEYAIAAFERGAIDYVLKPYEESRLVETITRIKERVVTNESDAESENVSEQLMTALKQLRGNEAAYLQWIKASVGQTVRLIPVDEVIYFESDEKYTRVALRDTEVLIRKPIKELAAELDPDRFWQIHRATIVNSRAIAGVVRGMRDQADLKLRDRPETLTVSRNYTHLFKQM